MSEKNKHEREKMTEAQRQRKIELERLIGVPDPPVPNRAHTELSRSDHAEMSARNEAEASTHTQSSKLNIDENALHEYADRYRRKRMNDVKRDMETE